MYKFFSSAIAGFILVVSEAASNRQSTQEKKVMQLITEIPSVKAVFAAQLLNCKL